MLAVIEQPLTTALVDSMRRSIMFEPHPSVFARVPTKRRLGGAGGAVVSVAMHRPAAPKVAAPPHTPRQSCHGGTATPMSEL